MAEELETDYLVVGAGAAGMAFTDSLLDHCDATITIVDRRHAPGGHWIDAYPYVRLHQPSAFYGVSSVPLGQDALDVAGTNAGYYETAGADVSTWLVDLVSSRGPIRAVSPPGRLGGRALGWPSFATGYGDDRPAWR